MPHQEPPDEGAARRLHAHECVYRTIDAGRATALNPRG